MKKIVCGVLGLMALFGLGCSLSVSSQAESTEPEPTLSLPVETRGDINGDGEINMVDLIYLRRYLAGWENVTMNDERAQRMADIDGNGNIDGKDVMQFRRYFAEWTDSDPVAYCSHEQAQLSYAWNAVPETGEESGITAVATLSCGECNAAVSSQPLPAERTSNRESAVCEEEIVVRYTVSVNGERDEKTVSLGKIEHQPNGAVRENEIPATCTASGGYDEVVYCASCETELSRTRLSIAATGHDYEKYGDSYYCVTETTIGISCKNCDEETREYNLPTYYNTSLTEGYPCVWKTKKPATCAEEGVIACVFSFAPDGKETYEVGFPLMKIPHTEGEAERVNVIEATCIAEGSYTSVVRCSHCGVTLSSEEKTIPIKEHSFDAQRVCTGCGREDVNNVITISSAEGYVEDILPLTLTVTDKVKFANLRVTLQYNPAVLEYISTGRTDERVTVESGDGMLTLSHTDDKNTVSECDLATLNFRIVGADRSALSLGVSSASYFDPNGNLSSMGMLTWDGAVVGKEVMAEERNAFSVSGIDAAVGEETSVTVSLGGVVRLQAGVFYFDFDHTLLSFLGYEVLSGDLNIEVNDKGGRLVIVCDGERNVMNPCKLVRLRFSALRAGGAEMNLTVKDIAYTNADDLPVSTTAVDSSAYALIQ